MHPIADYQLPTAAARFQPRKQEGIFSNIIQTAWRDYAEAMLPEAEREGVQATITDLLETRTPAADLDVLRRYGFTESRESASVRMYDSETQRWDATAGIPLIRKVEVPKGGGWFNACGPRYSEWPDRGITPKYEAELRAEPGAYEAFCLDQEQREAGYLPRELDAFFQRILDARRAEREQYRAATGWPAEVKAETGVYPTWAEIEARFPFIGQYLAKRRVAAGEAEAARQVAA